MAIDTIKNTKIMLLFASLATLCLMIGVAYYENFQGEWRSHQENYKAQLVASASDVNAKNSALSFVVNHKQIYLTELGKIDRCTTCHLGVENPNLVQAEQPLTKHPGTYLDYHPVSKFGCTICHQGQGRAVTKHQAHGWDSDGHRVKHAEEPILRGKRVYASCGQCHDQGDLYGGLQDLYVTAENHSKVPIDAKLLASSLPGADNIRRGKKLTIEKGCLGCHIYRGRGGTLGPDITYVGEKTIHDFDFSHVKGEHTVDRWLYEHFMFPDEISPGTSMPDMGFGDQEAKDLTDYMMSLRRKSAPASLRPRPRESLQQSIEPVRGDTLYAMFCSACHGAEGIGSTMRTGLWPKDADPWGHTWDSRKVVSETRNDLEVIVPSINHEDTLAIASDDFLRHVISKGRPGTKMIAWGSEGGLTENEITLLVDHIRGWSRPNIELSDVAADRGNPKIGQALYRANCSVCHGVDGEGAIGASLRSPTFLAIASDAYLRDSIIHGRPNTAMPAWRSFDAQELSDLIAFMRQWQPKVASVKESEALVNQGETQEVSTKIGKILYDSNCAICHGYEGRGDLAPTLNTPEFLSIANNRFLITTLIKGRPSTSMPSWRHFKNEDIASLTLYLRSLQTRPSVPESWYEEETLRGEPESGQVLYVQMCSGCHGESGEGATGPQLNNPVFLEQANDRMLTEWIKNGKSGTEMRAFRKGGQGVAELSDRQISDIVSFLRSLEHVKDSSINRVAKSPHGRPEKGAPLYEKNCSGCHGSFGEGSSGPALSNPEFLRVASDGFLIATMALGRSGTEMRPVKSGPQSILELTSDEVNDVVAFIRSWEQDPPFKSKDNIPHRFVIPWDLNRGKELYDSNCAGCHGVEGKGAWAPELNNEGFLTGATDGFLQATIVLGRKGTAMRAFGKGHHGVSELSSESIDDIVAYIRSWSRETPSPMTVPADTSIKKTTSSVLSPTEAGSHLNHQENSNPHHLQKES